MSGYAYRFIPSIFFISRICGAKSIFFIRCASAPMLKHEPVSLPIFHILRAELRVAVDIADIELPCYLMLFCKEP